MTTLHTTREGWLVGAVELLDEAFFAMNGYELPEKLGVSCGFPKGVSKAIGQCFSPKVCEDGTTHIFICPSQAEPTRVLDILLHEMIHASVGIKAKHGGAFKKLALEFGLSGKMTATVVEEGSELFKKLQVIAGKLKAYPHTPMQKLLKPKKPNPWVRFYSSQDDKYTLVINIKKVIEHGVPKDWSGRDMIPKGDDTLEDLFEMWGE